jgi:hypothetical protein
MWSKFRKSKGVVVILPSGRDGDDDDESEARSKS